MKVNGEISVKSLSVYKEGKNKMEYIYSFDALKKHTLSFNFTIDQYLEKANAVIDVFCTGVVTETKNGKVLHKEAKSRTFSFKSKSDKQKQHDFNISRIRYAKQKKWILNITNNETNTEVLEVGIISETANKNPLFLDVYSNDKKYSYYLKGNNLAILEANYVAPILEQTIVDYAFNEPGVPEGFVVDSSSYNESMKAITTDSFVYSLPAEIPKETSFSVSMNVVPKELGLTPDGSLFSASINGIGEMIAYADHISYLGEGFPESQRISLQLKQPITAIGQLYENVYNKISKLQFICDGKGLLTISYMGEGIITQYDKDKDYQIVRVSGGLISSATENDGSVTNTLLKQNIDNITVKFQK